MSPLPARYTDAINRPRHAVITVDIANQQDALPLDEDRLRCAVRGILEEASLAEGQISVAVVDDATIRRLHREYLDVDEPTDVMSFVLDRDASRLEGEVIASAETARRRAPQYDWPAEDELLLYVIHGMLHLVGYDDTTAPQRSEMRRQEQAHLGRFDLEHRWDESPAGGDRDR